MDAKEKFYKTLAYLDEQQGPYVYVSHRFRLVKLDGYFTLEDLEKVVAAYRQYLVEVDDE